MGLTSIRRTNTPLRSLLRRLWTGQVRDGAATCQCGRPGRALQLVAADLAAASRVDLRVWTRLASVSSSASSRARVLPDRDVVEVSMSSVSPVLAGRRGSLTLVLAAFVERPSGDGATSSPVVTCAVGRVNREGVGWGAMRNSPSDGGGMLSCSRGGPRGSPAP